MNRLIRYAGFAVAAALLAARHAGAATLQTADLNGTPVAIPGGLTSDRALLLVGFQHKDQALLDGWRDGLGLKAADVGWWETPVIPVTSPMIKPMILGGMKKTFVTPADRAHVAPVFGDAKAVAGGLGLEPGDVAVLVLDRAGHVLASARGAYDPEKARPLAAAMHPPG